MHSAEINVEEANKCSRRERFEQNAILDIRYLFARVLTPSLSFDMLEPGVFIVMQAPLFAFISRRYSALLGVGIS